MYIDLQTYSVQTLEHLLGRFKVGLWTSYSYQIVYAPQMILFVHHISKRSLSEAERPKKSTNDYRMATVGVEAHTRCPPQTTNKRKQQENKIK